MKHLILLLLFSINSYAVVIKLTTEFENLEEYNSCQTVSRSGEICTTMLSTWVEKHPGDAWKAGKMVRKKMIAWAAIPFFEKASTLKDFDCKDEDLKLAVLSGLNLPEKENQEVVKAAIHIGFKDCKTQMKKAIEKEASMDSFLFINTCERLDTEGLKKKKCSELKKAKK